MIKPRSGKKLTTLEFARRFAEQSHAGQVRKYTGEAYITHPIRVAELVNEHVQDDNVLCAALLHDVVEDCEVTIEEIEQLFGEEIAEYVWYLTKPPSFVGDREKRKRLDRARLQEAPALVRFVKVMDIFHNSLSIREHDPEFYKTFREESKLMLDAMNAFSVVNEFAGREFASTEFKTWLGEL